MIYYGIAHDPSMGSRMTYYGIEHDLLWDRA